jgi:large subunit ribosomal protein L25
MDIDTLNVTGRTETGKGPNRRLRSQGQVPAVIYGSAQEPIMVALNFRELEKALSKPNAETNLFALAGEGIEKTTAVIREIQRDPVTRRFLHVDLFRVRMDHESEFEVPIHATRTPAGVREGGMLETHLRSITVKCLPGKLPESIDVDISGLQINKSLHVSDVQLPQGLTLVTDGAETLYGVHAVKVASETAEEAAGQPEVIGKKKEEE